MGTNRKVTKGESYAQLVWRKFKKSRLGLLGMGVVFLILTLSVFAPFFAPNDYLKSHTQSFMPPQQLHLFDEVGNFHLRPFVYNYKLSFDPNTFKRIWVEDTEQLFSIHFFVRGDYYKLLGIFPSNIHLFGVEKRGRIFLFGTDQYGRDLLARILMGGRISLLVAFLGAFFGIIVGSIIGGISGYYGGRADMVIQRVIELLQTFPQIPLWMILSVAFPPRWSSFTVFMGIVAIFALLGWGWLAREIRAKVLSLRDREFVLAAKEMGASDTRIILRHLLPNCFSHIIVVSTINVAWFILVESVLSFLGLGLQPPMVSWGVLLQKAQDLQTLARHPWITLPGVFIIVTVLGFNFLGDGLRDAADPYSR